MAEETEEEKIDRVLSEKLSSIINDLAARLGREPTEEEVYNFIFGDEATQLSVWNAEVKSELD